MQKTYKKPTILFVDFTKALGLHSQREMGQIHPAYGLSKETAAAIMMLCRNIEVKVCSLDGDTDYFGIVTGVLQGDTFAPYLFIIWLNYK